MTATPAVALEACLALLEKATAGEIECRESHVSFAFVIERAGKRLATFNEDSEAEARLCAAAVNLLRTHGPALLAEMRLREWRPIASAPKDGTEFDVWCPEDCAPENGYRIARCWWSRVDQRFRAYGDDLVTWAHEPTHWMPLPAPPTADDLARVLEEGK